jgi:CDP-diacylglycerol--glycerol-3-phosphate 3-phosphatidyltransferase
MFNLPNSITAVRILLVPVFVWLLLNSTTSIHSTNRWFALAVFIIAMSTDGLDGYLARQRGLVTNLGKILDPIADKALIGGALVTLSVLGAVDWWLTALLLARELGITFYRFAVIRKRIVAASGGGKLKTVLQSITVGLLLAPMTSFWPGWYKSVSLGMLYLTLLVTIYTGLQYLVAATKHADDLPASADEPHVKSDSHKHDA